MVLKNMMQGLPTRVLHLMSIKLLYMKKRKLIQKIREISSGQLTGGFVVLSTNALVIGGVTDPVNNCIGGDCSNNCSKANCGNCVAGCGVKQ
jgi:hypothetical protein